MRLLTGVFYDFDSGHPVVLVLDEVSIIIPSMFLLDSCLSSQRSSPPRIPVSDLSLSVSPAPARSHQSLCLLRIQRGQLLTPEVTITIVIGG